jgi:hypothetical protein
MIDLNPDDKNEIDPTDRPKTHTPVILSYAQPPRTQSYAILVFCAGFFYMIGGLVIVAAMLGKVVPYVAGWSLLAIVGLAGYFSVRGRYLAFLLGLSCGLVAIGLLVGICFGAI